MVENVLFLVSGLLFILIVFILLFLFYHDVFKKVSIMDIDFQPFGFIFKSHKGSYKYNVEVLNQVADFVKTSGITVVNAATIYYHNQRKSKSKQRLSDVGFMIAEQSYRNLPTDIQVKTVQHNQYLATSVVYKSRFSVLLGAMRVYPAFRKELKKQGLSEREIIEIYDMRNKLIVYLMPRDAELLQTS